ncbi:hypothetical protein ANN_07556 [Periplaneta americana]|uniref:Uncharacterized protein n=1 Tax=Periplaneta americana TaxID=6978 RepID=A0ABQ8T0J7_PERAM|nr:hypothetical protein ANN_07556 [Periplaneta americana]
MFLIMPGEEYNASPDLTPLDFFPVVEKRSLQRKSKPRADLIVRIMNNAALIKEQENDLRRATRGVIERSRKCIEVGGGIYENQL